MANLWLIPALPLIGFLILFVTQGRLPKMIVSVVAVGSVAGAAVLTLLAGMDFAANGQEPQTEVLWTWISVGGFTPSITMYFDGLSLVMTGVITGVGALIHLYATGYMWDDHEEPEGFSRFFSYMNLFVFAMLMLVLGDNLLVLFLGWEGVGLCSYLLIGFYHRDPANGYAARKAFVVTRVGDTFMAIGLFLLFYEFGSIEIQAVLSAAQAEWGDGTSVMATIIGLLLLGGAMGKSAQVPLHTWLPDAMAGPTPVSALIHAATMVTAGVYLIARMHDIYLLSEEAQYWVAITGLVTLFISSFTALTQRDIKRVLAFSTMSQIGYMIMALGVGAWSAAIFHLMTHAFFKALLFLASGSVILALHHEQDMFKMGGLWRKLPVPFLSMAVGSICLVALPFTSGFYSKDAILLTAWDGGNGTLFWGGAAFAAFMTALYTTRMMIITFFGETKTEPHGHQGLNMNGPLVILMVLSLVGGFIGVGYVGSVLPDGGVGEFSHTTAIALVTTAIPILGVIAGWLIFRVKVIDPAKIVESAAGDALRRFFFSGWAFDWLYDRVFVMPLKWLARTNKNDIVDWIYRITTAIARGVHHVIALTQSGRLRWYAFNMAVGLFVVFLIVLEVV